MAANLGVSVTFRRDDNNRVKTFIYQDSPQFRDYGDYADLEQHEVLELLNRLGLGDQAAQEFMQQILQQTTVRRQFQLNPEQKGQIRQQFFSGQW